MSFLTTLPRTVKTFVIGESYWKVRLDRRIGDMVKTEYLSELDTKTYLDEQSREIRVRSVQWLEDICGSGDIKNIKEVTLCTPKGEAHLLITDPYTVFQLSRGTSSLFTGERLKNAQIVGKINNKSTGDATAYIWDVQSQELYELTFNVHDGIPAWREGVIAIGVINLKTMDVRLD